MKTKIFLSLSLALMLCACNEEHVYYNTAAEPGITADAQYEVGVPITFADNSVPTKGTTIVAYLWEFGDEAKSTSTEQNPTFTYKKDGAYTVVLTVTDSNGLKAQKKHNVVIVNPTKADFVLEKDEYYMGDVVKFINTSTSKGTTTITGYKWEFADENNSTSTEKDPTFVYNVEGSYPVKLTVTDSYGLTATITKSVSIQDPSKIIATQWTSALGGAVKGGSSPAVSPDGSTIYMLRSLAGTDVAALYALNTADGQMKWSFDVSKGIADAGGHADAQAKDIFSSCSVGADGTVYLIARDLQSTSANRCGLWTLAVNPNGSLKWGKVTGPTNANLYAVTPAIDADGNIYVANRSNQVWKFTAAGTGTSADTEKLGVTGGLSVAKNGVVYASANGANGFFAMDMNAGKQLWKYNTDFAAAPDAFTGALRSAQASIATDGTVYLVSDATTGGGQVIAFNPDGSTKWIHNTAGAIPDGGVAIAEDGTLYANGGTAVAEGLIALNADGSRKWAFATQAKVQTTPVIDDRGFIHVVDAMANYYVVKPDGTLLAESKLGDSCTSAPVMDGSGRLMVVVDKAGVPTVVCATSKAASYSTTAQWAMRGQCPQRTGAQK